MQISGEVSSEIITASTRLHDLKFQLLIIYEVKFLVIFNGNKLS